MARAASFLAILSFLLTRNEAGLFAVAAFFGLGFSGVIPAYVLAVRELFPASEAAWRVPTLLLFSGSGMAAGSRASFMTGSASTAWAFAAGLQFNLANLILIGMLVLRHHQLSHSAVAGIAAQIGDQAGGG